MFDETAIGTDRHLGPQALAAFACWVVLALLATAVPAQLGEIEFDRFSVEDGLSHSTVHAIHQDARGFLWFGTQEGLNRYDGYHFEVFKHDPDDPASLPDSFISMVYGDRRGGLWVATAAGGVSRLDAGGEGFVHYRHDPADDRSLSSGEVLALLEDRDGALWVGTGTGLDRLLGPEGELSHHRPRIAPAGEPPAVLALHEDPDGGLWAGTTAGLFRLDRESGVLARFASGPSALEGRLSGTISAIQHDPGGSLWLVAAAGLLRLDPRSSELEVFRYHDLAPGTAGEHFATVMRIDRAGDLWVGFQGHGLSRLATGSGEVRHYRGDALDAWGLSDNSALAIFEDQTGILWIGNYVGVNKYDPGDRFVTYRQRAGRGLSSSSIWAIYEDRAGALWVGTYDSGLDRVDRERGEVVHYPPAPNDPGGLPNGTVSAVVEDPAGRLWVGTWGGLSRLERSAGRDRGRFVTYRHDPADPASLSDAGVATLHLDGSGRLWVGTYAGLDRYDPAGDRFIRYPTDPRDPESLGRAPIVTICEGRGGELWFGSDSSGLYRLDPESERFDRYRHDSANRESLSSDRIAALHVDRSGVLWAGTYGGGLNRLESGRLSSASARFTRYREKDGLANDSVLGILEDARGRLWLATNHGLSRFDPASGSFRSYSAGNGLQGTVYSSGSAFQGAGGEMFFGGVGGLDAFFPERVVEDLEPPPVAITGLRRFSRSRPIEDVRLEPLPAGELVLDHRDYALGFEFAALHFRSPPDNRYAYLLEGFDPGWIEVDAARRFARYSSLPAGRYTFRVKASNSDGVWNDGGARVAIRVLPPPWKTWWAYTLYGVSLVAAAAGYVRWQQRKIERERRINRRLRQVDRLKDEFLANTSHELRTPLFGITGLAESLIDGATGELSGETRENLSMIVASGRRLSGLVGDILDFSRLSKKSLELQRGPVDLRVLVEVVLSLSRPLVGSKELELVNAVAPDLPAADADENRLQQILHNLLGNAIKFTESGTVEVSAVEEDARLLVRVVDTGIGIADDQLERIFKPFEQADASSERVHGGTGLGLAVTQHLVRLHGGAIWVESAVGEGSTFSFTLPVSTQEVAPAGDRPAGVQPSDSPPAAAAATDAPRPLEHESGASEPAGVDETLPASLAGSQAGDFRLLIVEDEPVIRQVLMNYLSAEGYLLEQASSGAEALRLVAERRFDLVLLDVMMPRMSGYEVCRELRRRNSRQELPVIFLTAKHRTSDLATGFASGANDYLAKPIAKRELVSRVAAHLDLLDAHRQLASLLAEKTAWTGELEARNAELARFTYTVSHDLKSPLVTINGFLGLLEKDAREERFERMEHDLQRIRGATARMRQLLDDLLELSRVGRTAGTLEDVELGAVACEALSMVATQVADRGVEVAIAPDLPAVTGARLRLIEVYQNLLENAVKYMGDQPEPRIEVDARRDGEGIVFCVRDNGMGIDPAYHRKVFELFERLSADTAGTGVGLALVKRIVEVHGGRVWVESEGRGRGSTFCFTLEGG